MGMGALAVVGIGGTALGVSIAGFFEQLSRFFEGLISAVTEAESLRSRDVSFKQHQVARRSNFGELRSDGDKYDSFVFGGNLVALQQAGGYVQSSGGAVRIAVIDAPKTPLTYVMEKR